MILFFWTGIVLSWIAIGHSVTAQVRLKRSRELWRVREALLLDQLARYQNYTKSLEDKLFLQKLPEKSKRYFPN